MNQDNVTAHIMAAMPHHTEEGITAGELAEKLFGIPRSPQKANESTFKKLHAQLDQLEQDDIIVGSDRRFPPRKFTRSKP